MIVLVEGSVHCSICRIYAVDDRPPWRIREEEQRKHTVFLNGSGYKKLRNWLFEQDKEIVYKC